MPRYYFDVRDGNGFHHDEIGAEFDNFEAAKKQLYSMLPDIVREELRDGEFHEVSCNMRDQTGGVVYHGKFTYRGTRF